MKSAVSQSLTEFFESRPESGVQSAYLFGSEAAGRAHQESDVDVAVLLDRSRHADRSSRADFAVSLNAELVEALRRNEVDVVVLNDAPPELGRAVVQNGFRVYCADEPADHAFRRDVQLLAADVQIFLDRMRAIKLRKLRA